jgi:hypothetical protein
VTVTETLVDDLIEVASGVTVAVVTEWSAITSPPALGTAVPPLLVPPIAQTRAA